MSIATPPSRLTRTQFVKIAAGLAGGASAAYLLYEWAPWLNSKIAAASNRQPLRPGPLGKPPMRELIRYASLAASGHNAQPWRFSVEGLNIKFRPDPNRRLPAVDPDDRELWISLGCALENLTLAAQASGYESEITYPGQDDWIQVKLVPRKPEESRHFSAIITRQNTRSEFDGQKLESARLAEIISIPLEPGIHLRSLESQADLSKTLEYISAGNARQFADQPFMDELVHWVRFDKREAMASMDGLASRSMGTPQVPRWIGQQFLRRMGAQKQNDIDAKKLRSSAGAITIASSSDTKEAWVRTGQVYQRLALKMTSLNIKSAFLNQPCEVPALRQQFQSALGFGDSLPQLLIRYGYADPMPMSFRRSVDEVTTWA